MHMDARQGEVRYKNFEPQELASKTRPIGCPLGWSSWT